MYDIFYKFIEGEQWKNLSGSTNHLFYRALREVVQKEEFNAQEMGGYMKGKLRLKEGEHKDLLSRIDYLVTLSQSVWLYYSNLRKKRNEQLID